MCSRSRTAPRWGEGDTAYPYVKTRTHPNPVDRHRDSYRHTESSYRHTDKSYRHSGSNNKNSQNSYTHTYIQQTRTRYRFEYKYSHGELTKSGATYQSGLLPGTDTNPGPQRVPVQRFLFSYFYECLKSRRKST